MPCSGSSDHYEPRTVTNRVHQLSLWLFATAAIFGCFTLLVPSVCAAYQLQSMSAITQMSVMGTLGTLAALVGACATRTIAQVQKPAGLEKRIERRDVTASPFLSEASLSRGSSGLSSLSSSQELPPMHPANSGLERTPPGSDDEWVITDDSRKRESGADTRRS